MDENIIQSVETENQQKKISSEDKENGLVELRSSKYEDLEYCKAAAECNLKALNKMVAEQAPRNDASSDDKIRESKTKEKVDLSKVIVNAPKYEINCKDDVGLSPLHYAAKYGHYEAVKLLVSNGAAVNAQDWNLVNPLHLAARNQHVKIVKFFVMSGGDIHAQCRSGCKPVDFAPYDSETWQVLHNAEMGILPVLDHLKEVRDIPTIPQFAIMTKQPKDSKKKGGKGSKGKKAKGKKSGSGKKKKGGKKSGKKGKKKKK